MNKNILLVIGGTIFAGLGLFGLIRNNKKAVVPSGTPAPVPSFSPEGLNIDPKTVTK